MSIQLVVDTQAVFPGPLDLGMFLLLAIALPLEAMLWSYPRMMRGLAAGDPGARTRGYRTALLLLWGLAFVLVSLWWLQQRSFGLLWLHPKSPLGLMLGLAVAALYLAVVWQQMRALRIKPDALARLRQRLTGIEPMIPHTASEYRLFVALSITAGVCEELLFRGFMTWYLSCFVGLLPAVVIGNAIFGAAHIYLGALNAVRAGIVGMVMSALVFATGSLLPAMALHAAIDFASGSMGRLALDATPREASAP